MSIATVHAISAILYALCWIVDLKLHKGTFILLVWSKFYVLNAGIRVFVHMVNFRWEKYHILFIHLILGSTFYFSVASSGKENHKFLVQSNVNFHVPLKSSIITFASCRHHIYYVRVLDICL